MDGVVLSKYTDAHIQKTWLKSTLAVWRATIRDIEQGQPDDREWIDAMWRDLGWSWFIDSRGDKGYDEAPESWCGAGLAWIGRHRFGEHLEPHLCVDARLRSDIASQVLPGTDRMFDRARWKDLGFDKWPGIDANEISVTDTAEHLSPGVICTVGDDRDGSHIVMVEAVNADNGTYRTVECNAYGVLGDGFYGEGIVRRYDAGLVFGYNRTEHAVKARKIEDIRCIYTPSSEWFAGI